MGLPPRIAVPIMAVFTVAFLGVMAYLLRIGFATTGSAFGPGVAQHEQGDARIQATAAPLATDPPGVVTIPQTGTGTQSDATALPGNPVGGGGPPAAVRAMLADLNARVERNPRDIAALVALGNLYFDARKFDRAIPYYKRALALDPTNPEVRSNQAAALHETGHDLEALHEIDTVLRERARFPQALFNRAVVLRSIGRRSDARRAYASFLEAAPDDPRAPEAKAALAELRG